ncbi:helix-turn-helix domain-containing protein [Coprococcus eutactus]|uniref:helix-turn-helix domain-containing protein n=1 Tax=Coprococcus eutactus TaxID=33043 RepID=UPI000677AEDB|nr:helix-turn-helix transcriptional regulator [Coprococcus eutactus]UEA78626.1 helix-turn-helix domain-containing protein [Coprococcus eutactus ATCC 27759]UWP16987.1 helix-turn-helix domain-containing protein [Coprococcus eutactus]
MTFGERLYELRNKNNLSQEELAEVLDVSRQSISKWENDKAYPEMTRLLFMSDYFDVSLDYLMRGIKKENNEEKVTADDADKISNDKYKTKNILLVWNNFLSNLSPNQKTLFMLLYILIICSLVALIVSVIYLGGYEIGKFIGYLTK